MRLNLNRIILIKKDVSSIAIFIYFLLVKFSYYNNVLFNKRILMDIVKINNE